MSRRRGKSLVVAAALSAALIGAGCGRDDFENDPRPPLPLEVTVEITDKAVQASPTRFGAGLVNFVIANSSAEPASFRIDGPTTASSLPIPPRGNAVFKAQLEAGRYTVSIVNRDAVKPAELRVGPTRESSQNDLLLP